MASNDYVFLTEWRVDAPRDLVYDILSDGGDYPRWWPEVYLAARVERPADGGDIGTKVHLHTKGWLPYTLTWTAETVRIDRPAGFEISAVGDFNGKGIWTFTEEGATTHIRFDWILRAEKPLIRAFSFCLKPIFKWNHRWAMERGYERLQKEIARRRGTQSSTSPAAGLSSVSV